MGATDSLLFAIAMIWLAEKGLAVHHKRQRLTIRSPLYDTEPQPAFMHLPEWCGDRGFEDYEKVCLEENFCYHMDLYCRCNDPRFCLFFDKKCRLAGIQTSYILEDLAHISPQEYNVSNQNYIDTKLYGITAKSVRFYLTNPEELTEEGRKNTSSDIVDGLWIKLNGKLVRFDSKYQPNSPVIGDFVIQGCAPTIGQLFVRDLHETDTCTNGFFLYMVYENRKLVGFGHGIPGIVSKGPKVDPFNHPTGPYLASLFPNAPPCFWDLDRHGWTVFGLYLVEDPWSIRCPICRCI